MKEFRTSLNLVAALISLHMAVSPAVPGLFGIVLAILSAFNFMHVLNYFKGE